MTLAAFLNQFFGGLRAAGVRFCVLRNYDGLPGQLNSNDIDMLVLEADLDTALQTLAHVPGIVVANVAQRPYVTSAFVYGIDEGFLELDFVVLLGRLGHEYLQTDCVLARARPSPSCAWVPVPHPVDEALVSFMSSYLLGGFIKDRYASAYLPVFGSRQNEALQQLAGRLSPLLARRLFGAIAQGKTAQALRLLRPIRRSLLLRALRREPGRAVRALIRHYRCELGFVLGWRHLTQIAVLGPDGAGKSSVLRQLLPRMEGVAKQVLVVHLRPAWPLRRQRNSAPVQDPHGRAPKGTLLSVLQLGWWLAVMWIGRWTNVHRNATLCIYDRYYDDLLVDPRRYRYGGPMVLARLAARLMPRPELVVLLDAPAEVLQARKPEVTFEESRRQRDAYRAVVGRMKSGRIVDASRPLDEVVSDVQRIVLDYMAARTARRMGWNTP